MRAVFEVTKNHFAGIVSTSLTYFPLGESKSLVESKLEDHKYKIGRQLW